MWLECLRTVTVDTCPCVQDRKAWEGKVEQPAASCVRGIRCVSPCGLPCNSGESPRGRAGWRCAGGTLQAPRMRLTFRTALLQSQCPGPNGLSWRSGHCESPAGMELGEIEHGDPLLCPQCSRKMGLCAKGRPRPPLVGWAEIGRLPTPRPAPLWSLGLWMVRPRAASWQRAVGHL